VQKQDPPGKTWVAPDEKIKLTIYDFAPIKISGIVKQASMEEDEVWADATDIKTKGLPGVTLRIRVAGVEKNIMSGHDGTFSVLFGEKPVTKEKANAAVTASRDGYKPFEKEMPFYHDAEWEILMVSAEKAVVDVSIENVKREMSNTSIPWANWEFDVVFKPRNVGIRLFKEKIVDRGENYEDDLRRTLVINPGEEDRVRQRTNSNYNTSLQANDRTVTFLGEDFNGNPIEISVNFPKDADSALQAEADDDSDDQGFSDENANWSGIDEYVDEQNQENNPVASNSQDLAPLPPSALAGAASAPEPVPVRTQPAVTQQQVNTRNNNQQQQLNNFFNMMTQTVNTINQIKSENDTRSNNTRNNTRNTVKTPTFTPRNYSGMDALNSTGYQSPFMSNSSSGVKSPSSSSISGTSTSSNSISGTRTSSGSNNTSGTGRPPVNNSNTINLLGVEVDEVKSPFAQ
jgi:hypothetical protein